MDRRILICRVLRGGRILGSLEAGSMNRLTGLSILVVALAMAGNLAAQETGSAASKVEGQQASVAAEASTTSAAIETPQQPEAKSVQPAAEQSQAPAVVET